MRHRLTAELLKSAHEHIQEAKAEPVEYERDAAGDLILEYGRPKIKPARLHIRLPARIIASLSLPPSSVRQLRETLGLTQTEAAALVGASPRTWRSWEAGDTVPDPASMHKLHRLKESATEAPAVTPEQIRATRQAYRYTVQAFAAVYSVTAATLGRWESGVSTPRPQHRRQLAEDWQTAQEMGLVK